MNCTDTPVYWVPIFARLEQRGLRPSLVTARQVKTVPGRQTDGNDAQWLQQLHTLGWLQAAFRPDAEMCVRRTLLRHRATVIEHRAPHMLHLQKALTLMNMPLREVLTEITGVSGQAILRAIVAGERAPVKLAPWRHPACKSSADKIAKALSGTWRDELLCMLQHALERFDAYPQKSTACDAQIERQFAAMKPRFKREEPPTALPRTKPGSQAKHKPRSDARADLLRLTGVDVVAVAQPARAL